MVITGYNNITAVGHNAITTASSVRSGISRFSESDEYFDNNGNPVIASPVRFFGSLKNKEDQLELMTKNCFNHMVDHYLNNKTNLFKDIYFLLGFPHEKRPGLNNEKLGSGIVNGLKDCIQQYNIENIHFHIVPTGNTSVLHCIENADSILKQNPDVLCIVGGIDSLLDYNTLNWFEESHRLLSESFRRNHCFIPGESVAFMIIESEQKAVSETILAHIKEVKIANEPAGFLSDKPCKGEGLTEVFLSLLSQYPDNSIETAINDLNGEAFRVKEWMYARMRSIKNKKIDTFQPADNFGNIGAASGAVFSGIAIEGFSRGWMKPDILISCSDDHGERGAMILSR